MERAWEKRLNEGRRQRRSVRLTVKRTKAARKEQLEDMVEAQVAAHFRIQEEEARREKEERAKWRAFVLKEKEVEVGGESEKKKIELKQVKKRERREQNKILLKVLVWPRTYARPEMGAMLLMNLFVQGVLGLVEWAAYGFALLLLASAIYGFSIIDLTTWIFALLAIIIIIICLVLYARFFRMARVSVEQTTDQQNIVAIFSALATFLALVITTLAFWKTAAC